LFRFNICGLGYVGEVWGLSFIRCCLCQCQISMSG
jgi:hypothetical protein